MGFFLFTKNAVVDSDLQVRASVIMCGHTIFMTRRYPLNNSDIIMIILYPCFKTVIIKGNNFLDFLFHFLSPSLMEASSKGKTLLF